MTRARDELPGYVRAFHVSGWTGSPGEVTRVQVLHRDICGHGARQGARLLVALAATSGRQFPALSGTSEGRTTSTRERSIIAQTPLGTECSGKGISGPPNLGSSDVCVVRILKTGIDRKGQGS